MSTPYGKRHLVGLPLPTDMGLYHRAGSAVKSFIAEHLKYGLNLCTDALEVHPPEILVFDSWFHECFKMLPETQQRQVIEIITKQYAGRMLEEWSFSDFYYIGFFLIEMEHTDEYITYDLVGFADVETPALRKFIKSNFIRYRVTANNNKFVLGKQSKYLRIDTSDITFMELLGKRVSTKTMLKTV